MKKLLLNLLMQYFHLCEHPGKLGLYFALAMFYFRSYGFQKFSSIVDLIQ